MSTVVFADIGAVNFPSQGTVIDRAGMEVDASGWEWNRLTRWRHNALMHRMTIQQLDEPLQENDRGRSDR